MKNYVLCCWFVFADIHISSIRKKTLPSSHLQLLSFHCAFVYAGTCPCLCSWVSDSIYYLHQSPTCICYVGYYWFLSSEFNYVPFADSIIHNGTQCDILKQYRQFLSWIWITIPNTICWNYLPAIYIAWYYTLMNEWMNEWELVSELVHGVVQRVSGWVSEWVWVSVSERANERAREGGRACGRVGGGKGRGKGRES